MRLIEQFGRDMLQQADPEQVITGRDEELKQLLRILCRQRKNNAALVGEPGVGKTALAEALAQRMAAGKVPLQLRQKRLFALEMASLLAGTKYRGEFEERVRDLLDEAARNGNVIFFIDEMHTLMGAGASEGSIDAANLLKPALSRGRVQVIGATTDREYAKYVEPDAALDRRFCRLELREPDTAQTIRILRGLRPGLERFHRVRIRDEAIEAAVTLSDCCLTGRFQPDKALDLLDESAAAVVLDKGLARAVTRQDVAEAVCRRTGIPVQRLRAGEGQVLLGLERRLERRVIGQTEAIRTVAAAVRRGRAGLAGENRPRAAILLAGPTGVGKTELCKALAREVFGTEKALIRLDMSEYMEPHSVSRLLGAPPGYVGHGEGGELTEQIRRRPYSLILLDELEKAHRDVTGILLQLLSEGRLTDARGRAADFRQCMILMTTNAGSGPWARKTAGFGSAGEAGLRASLEALFSPELLGRMDAVVRLRSLDRADLAKIAALELERVLCRARAAGLPVTVSGDLAGLLADRCEAASGGARALQRQLRTLVEDPLADLLLSGCGGPVELRVERDSVCVRSGAVPAGSLFFSENFSGKISESDCIFPAKQLY